MRNTILTFAILSANLIAASAFADTVAIAVASNFKDTLSELADEFERRSGHVVQMSAASTGKHYAQIINGAPFDVFLAADAERPRLLADQGLVVAGSGRLYALGLLTLWAPDLTDKDCESAFLAGEFDRLAVANPRTAPYGLAAEQLLQTLGLHETYKPRLVTGENISQAMHFVDAGAAPAGLVASSHWLANSRREQGCHWKVPVEMHEPIEQHAVLLTRARDSKAAVDFMAFLASDEARRIIQAHGYATGD